MPKPPRSPCRHSTCSQITRKSLPATHHAAATESHTCMIHQVMIGIDCKPAHANAPITHNTCSQLAVGIDPLAGKKKGNK